MKSSKRREFGSSMKRNWELPCTTFRSREVILLLDHNRCGKQDVFLCFMFKGLKMIEENHSQKGSFSLQLTSQFTQRVEMC